MHSADQTPYINDVTIRVVSVENTRSSVNGLTPPAAKVAAAVASIDTVIVVEHAPK